ncbi:MAG: ABC transporter ATP-binding protein [Anaerolineaceae bacterium]|nr:ABC transporter ATP-binding protein [Anaerolineaceae bacterium]
MSRIELKNVDKYYGSNHVLKNLNLTIEDGEFMTLLGPSGCGKTTTLRVLSGLENPQHGVILMDGTEVVNADDLFFMAPSKRGLNLVFQSYALWPHMTVFENVAFGLSLKKMPKEEIKKRVKDALDRMQIGEFINRYPSELSGGQQQRVAIARAIVSEPKLLLLDEPLSNLDAKLRMDMRTEIKRLHKDLGTTVVYVTHDQTEALTMSTRIAIFFKGVLEQVDTPIHIYTNPVSLKVADFIGNPKTNFVDAIGEVRDGRMYVKSPIGNFDFNSKYFTDEEIPSGEFEVVLGVRPEQIVLHDGDKGQHAEGHIYSVQPSGSETLVQVKVNDTILLVKEIGLKRYQDDQKVSLTVHTHLMTVYNKATSRLIKYAIETEEDLEQ